MNRMYFGGGQLTALVALLFLAGLARAQQDVTFLVPIHLTNLPPEVNAVSACCIIPKLSTGGGGTSSAINPAQYACSQQQLAVSNGTANGELAVHATPQKNSAKENAFNYECQARLTAVIDGARVFLWPANGNAPPTRSGKFFVQGKGMVGKMN